MIWHQMKFYLGLNLSKNGKYNFVLADLVRMRSLFLCVNFCHLPSERLKLLVIMGAQLRKPLEPNPLAPYCRDLGTGVSGESHSGPYHAKRRRALGWLCITL